MIGTVDCVYFNHNSLHYLPPTLPGASEPGLLSVSLLLFSDADVSICFCQCIDEGWFIFISSLLTCCCVVCFMDQRLCKYLKWLECGIRWPNGCWLKHYLFTVQSIQYGMQEFKRSPYGKGFDLLLILYWERIKKKKKERETFSSSILWSFQTVITVQIIPRHVLPSPCRDYISQGSPKHYAEVH